MTAPQHPSRGVASGWHPDPSGRHQVRYWDGVRWTAYVGDGGRASTDPLPVIGIGAVQSAAGPPESEPAKGLGCMTALLAALAFAVTVAVITVGVVLALGLSMNDDHPGWLRFVSFTCGFIAVGLVVDARKRRGQRSGR